MAVSNHYLKQTLHHLSQVVPVSYRRIFAGVGIYHQRDLFALVVEDRLYFRVDEASVLPYLERQMPRLQPGSAIKSNSHFYQLPEAVLQSPAELLFWMRAAVEASHGLCSLSQEPAQTGKDSSQQAQRRSLAG